MKLIQSLQPLLAQGIALTLKLSASGEEKIQLDILPVGKDNKAGITLPPKAVIGTAQELDAGLEDFLEKYCATVGRVASIAADTDAELQALEKNANEQARKALEDKRNKHTPASKSAGKSGSSASKPARDPSAGLMDGDDENDNDGDASGGDVPGTTLNTNPGAESSAGGGASDSTQALTPSMF